MIINKLNDIGIDISNKDVFSLSEEGAVGRSHVARVLKNKNYVSTFSEAFEKYLAIGKEAYFDRYRLNTDEAIKIIKEAGGIPSLAHPGLIGNDLIINKIIEMGIEGIEAYYYEHNMKETNKYLKLAKKNNLLITGGSDDHGPGNKDGSRLGKIKLDYKLVEALKNSRKAVFN